MDGIPYVTYTIRSPTALVPPEDNLALLFDGDDDGTADFQVIYHAGHWNDAPPTPHWHYAEVERLSDLVPTGWTLHDDQPAPATKGIGVDVSPENDAFTIKVPAGLMGGIGSAYRLLLHVIDNGGDDPACNDTYVNMALPAGPDPFNRYVVPTWTSSAKYQRAVVGGDGSRLALADNVSGGSPTGCPLGSE